jgi:hypothetical protein
MEQTESILIYGNGPSVGQIDFRCVLKEAKIFRMTNFYFEDNTMQGRRSIVISILSLCFLVGRLIKNKDLCSDQLFRYRDNFLELPDTNFEDISNKD